MTRSELIELVMQRTPGLTRVQTEIIVEAFFQSIIDALNRGEKIEVRGFGNFKLKQRSPRKARNPKTGEIVEVPAKKVLHFKMGKELRELINKR
ncbi:MAG: integration host factor subunit beta [Candidatus Magnetominusculus sp. LBB02]|nr:integration host factor subunit beta [Candidatus Magnetominusculus sp. LBB02]